MSWQEEGVYFDYTWSPLPPKLAAPTLTVPLHLILSLLLAFFLHFLSLLKKCSIKPEITFLQVVGFDVFICQKDSYHTQYQMSMVVAVSSFHYRPQLHQTPKELFHRHPNLTQRLICPPFARSAHISLHKDSANLGGVTVLTLISRSPKYAHFGFASSVGTKWRSF